jgi:hypothetical protein
MSGGLNVGLVNHLGSARYLRDEKLKSACRKVPPPGGQMKNLYGSCAPNNALLNPRVFACAQADSGEQIEIRKVRRAGGSPALLKEGIDNGV